MPHDDICAIQMEHEGGSGSVEVVCAEGKSLWPILGVLELASGFFASFASFEKARGKDVVTRHVTLGGPAPDRKATSWQTTVDLAQFDLPVVRALIEVIYSEGITPSLQDLDFVQLVGFQICRPFPSDRSFWLSGKLLS